MTVVNKHKIDATIATFFAIFWGSDSLDGQKIIAAILIFFGVYLVSVRSLKDRKEKLS